MPSQIGGAITRAPLAEQLEALVRVGRVGEARKLAAGRGPADIGALADLLALPRTSRQPASGGRDFRLDAKWIREHQSEYQGSWVALCGGQLVDSDPSLSTPTERLGAGRDVLIARMEPLA